MPWADLGMLSLEIPLRLLFAGFDEVEEEEDELPPLLDVEELELFLETATPTAIAMISMTTKAARI